MIRLAASAASPAAAPWLPANLRSLASKRHKLPRRFPSSRRKQPRKMPRLVTGSDHHRKDNPRIPSNAMAKDKDHHAIAAASVAVKSANDAKAIELIELIKEVKEVNRISNSTNPGSATTEENGMLRKMKWTTVVRPR